MRATSTVVVLAGLIGSLVASDGYSQAPSCSLGGTCLSVIPTCRFDSPSNPLPPPPPTILNVSVVPSNPTVESLNSAVFRFDGANNPSALPAVVERVGNSLRVTYRGSFNPFIPIPQSLCYFGLGTLPRGNYHLEFWFSVNASAFGKISETDFAVGDAIPIPTLSLPTLLLLSLLLIAVGVRRSLTLRSTRTRLRRAGYLGR